MKVDRIIKRTIIVALIAGMLVFSPGKTDVAVALSDNVVYNLFATDGYTTLADGTLAYIFGFVGGRQGQPLTYYDWQTNSVQTLPDAPSPTGGKITEAERPLAGRAQFPAPIISAAVGDVVEIRLKNLGGNANLLAPNDPHSIHLHGLDVDAANDGVPETSVGAVPANGVIPIGGKKVADMQGAGNVIVYMFAPDHAGTYMYHCHQEASIHVAMGMYGALVVYNQGEAGASSGPGSGGGELYGWQYDKDYVLLLSDMDLRQNNSEAGGGGLFNNVMYQPQYWFINGLSFPNTIHAGVGFNWTDWIAAHPGYDPFIVGSVSNLSSAGTPGDKVLLRVINMGFQAHPMHMHGFHGKIIGSDARGWTFANDPLLTGWDAGMEKNTLLIGSGETYEWLLDFGQQKLAAAQYAPNATMGTTGEALFDTWVDPNTGQMGTQTRWSDPKNLPQSNTLTQYQAIPDPFVPGAAYVGGTVVGPDSLESQGPGGLPPELPYTEGQYFPFHNHNDYQATNNGVYPGGMFTMIMTLP